MPMMGSPSYPDSYAETRSEASEILKNMTFHTWYKVRDIMTDDEAEKRYFASSIQGHGVCHHSIRDFQKCFDADPRSKTRWMQGDLSLCAREQFFAWSCMAKWSSLYLKKCETEFYGVQKFGNRHNVSPAFLRMKNCVYDELGPEVSFELLFGDIDDIRTSSSMYNFSIFTNLRRKLEEFTTRTDIPRIRQTPTNEMEPHVEGSVNAHQHRGFPRFAEGYGNDHLVREGITSTTRMKSVAKDDLPQAPRQETGFSLFGGNSASSM